MASIPIETITQRLKELEAETKSIIINAPQVGSNLLVRALSAAQISRFVACDREAFLLAQLKNVYVMNDLVSLMEALTPLCETPPSTDENRN